MKVKLNGLLAVAAAGVLSLSLAPQANAMVELRLTNGASVVTVLDGGVGDACPQVNCVTYAGSVGNWTVVVSTGIANNAPPFLDLGSSNFSVSSSPGTLIMESSADGYTPAANGFTFAVGGTYGTTGNYDFSAYLANSNGLLDESNQLGSTLQFNTPSALNFGGNISGNISPSSSSPYSVTIKSVLSGVTTAFNSSSYDANLKMTAVPEPAVVTLLGGILLCTIGAVRRKARRA